MTWFRLPLFVWAHYATSIHYGSRHSRARHDPGPDGAGTSVQHRHLRSGARWRSVLFQHLFWFYSHPAVYIMILPGMGVICEVVSCFAARQLFGYKLVAFASMGIAVFGFFVWGHHMFSWAFDYAALVFSLLSIFVAIPSAIKVFNWTATCTKARSLSTRRCSMRWVSSACSPLAD